MVMRTWALSLPPPRQPSLIWVAHGAGRGRVLTCHQRYESTLGSLGFTPPGSLNFSGLLSWGCSGWGG